MRAVATTRTRTRAAASPPRQPATLPGSQSAVDRAEEGVPSPEQAERARVRGAILTIYRRHKVEQKINVDDVMRDWEQNHGQGTLAELLSKMEEKAVRVEASGGPWPLPKLKAQRKPKQPATGGSGPGRAKRPTDGARASATSARAAGCSRKAAGTRRGRDEPRVGGGAARKPGKANKTRRERPKKEKERQYKPPSGDKDTAAIVSTLEHIKRAGGDGSVTFEQIAGIETTKRLLRDAVRLPIVAKQFFKPEGDLEPYNGILLFGPPGTGKTMLAKAVASQFHTAFFNISSSVIESKWKGDSVKTIGTLFDMARFYSPCECSSGLDLSVLSLSEVLLVFCGLA